MQLLSNLCNYSIVFDFSPLDFHLPAIFPRVTQQKLQRVPREWRVMRNLEQTWLVRGKWEEWRFSACDWESSLERPAAGDRTKLQVSAYSDKHGVGFLPWNRSKVHWHPGRCSNFGSPFIPQWADSFELKLKSDKGEFRRLIARWGQELLPRRCKSVLAEVVSLWPGLHLNYCITARLYLMVFRVRCMQSALIFILRGCTKGRTSQLSVLEKSLTRCDRSRGKKRKCVSDS